MTRRSTLMGALVFLAGSVSLLSMSYADTEIPEVVEWAEFKRRFRREYVDATEEQHRRKIFAANLDFIRSHNVEADAGRSTYRLGVNDFTDLDNGEWARDYAQSNAERWPSLNRHESSVTVLHEAPPATHTPNATCSLYNHNLTQYTGGTVIGFTQEPGATECCSSCAQNPACQNYNYKFGTGCTLYSETDGATKPGGPLDACGGRTDPNELNWVTKGAVTSIKNQGQCGGCWAFAAVGAVEGAWQLATGELINLSEQQLMDCSNQGACLGGVVTSGFMYIQAKGLNSDADYNYTDGRKNTGQKNCWKAGENRTVATIDNYTEVPAGSELQLEAAVRFGPVAVGIDGASVAVQHYKSGILGNESDCPLPPSHAVLVVGFSKDYWLIKNSWGTLWGEQGYMRLARNVQTRPSWAGNMSCGVCGLTAQPSFPIKHKEKAPPLPPPAFPPRPPPPVFPHYGDPGLGGCLVDEIAGSITLANGQPGRFCAPQCPSTTPPPYNGTCPNDKPLTIDNKTTTAEGYCILASGTNYYCALECGPNVPGYPVTCPRDSTCQNTSKPGEAICAYFF